MSTTIFKKVDYELRGLVNDIALGRIGLPDIQRPFVWKNVKVRDLFDSMYKGFPVGYLLLWENGSAEGHRAIGADAKQVPPQLVIVDGQQRLTSLYAVVKNVPVVRDNYKTEPIRIAFNPLEEKFEVANAATRRDKTYIPDISQVWGNEINLFQLVGDYLEGLKSVQEISAQEQYRIQESFMKLQGLVSFPFTALQLDAAVSEEDVAEVFVRINSQGASLNQADFILTLMSVFWDEGRSELEQFCRQARQPTTPEQSSPFNYFVEPSPDQLLRVSVGVAFKRARLEYIYSILRGKDLETGDFSDDRRDSQFTLLKTAQAKVLTLNHWKGFLACLRQAGFRSRRTIISQVALFYSYVLYLLGKTEYGVDERILRRLIAQWFYMASLTGRYTRNPETMMESDLALLRNINGPDQFVTRLRNVCATAVTNDFWDVTLPNSLATQAARSPSLFAYEAALVLLDAPALCSEAKISEMLDPVAQGTRSAVERHHLFPRAFLDKQGISGTQNSNQIANYAYVEWADNVGISDHPPAEYVPSLRQRFRESQLARMYHCHALPENWEHLEYEAFLEIRRTLMAQVTREGYQRLANWDSTLEPEATIEMIADTSDLVVSGESDAVEFKSTLRVNVHTGANDHRMENAVLKTLAAFLNSAGGALVIGVADDGAPVGIDTDRFSDEDAMSLHLVNIGNSRMGPSAMARTHISFDDYEDVRVMRVACQPSPAPVYVKDGNQESFYIRTGPATTELTPSQIQSYINQHPKW